MKYRNLVIAVIFLMQIDLSWAATEIVFINERTKDGEQNTFTVNLFVQDNVSRIHFKNSDAEGETADSYFLKKIDSDTVFYINKAKNTCDQWAKGAFSQAFSRIMLNIKRKAKVKVTEKNIQKVLDQPAANMLGLQTKQIAIKINFRSTYKYLLFKDDMKVERMLNYWVTPDLENIDILSLFQKIGESTGDVVQDQELRDIFAATGADYRLKDEIIQTTTDKKGKQSTITILQYMQSIEDVPDLPDESLQTPSDCKLIESGDIEKKLKALIKDAIR